MIALSILFLATEIIHMLQGRTGLAQRYPWLVAFIFGLLHGFGFAGALSEIGLPQSDIPLALLFFNVGVEVGQLLTCVLDLLPQPMDKVLDQLLLGQRALFGDACLVLGQLGLDA